MGDPAPSAAQSTSVKVVITGPYGAGKTSLVRSLSEVTVLTTERRVSTPIGGDGDAIAMDFGRLSVPPDLLLYLFGSPAGGDLDTLWEILDAGLLGFVVLVDHQRPESLEEAHEILTAFRERADVPFVVAINKVPDGLESRAVQQVRHAFRLDETDRVLVTDVRDPARARAVLVELLVTAREHALQTRSTVV